MLLNASGTVIADAAYAGWGGCYSASYLPTPFGWKGQSGGYRDSESGLFLMGARYYSPALGRFVGRDPSGFATSRNKHRGIVAMDALGVLGRYIGAAMHDGWKPNFR